MFETIIQFEKITKRFPGVTALNEVTLRIERCCCHALVGENGAGKSTLGKILAGLYSPDEGKIILKGKEVILNSPHIANSHGIGIVHQELAFCENLSVAENLTLGNMPRNGLFVNKNKMIELAVNALAEIGADVDPSAILGSLTVGKQQLVQIAGAVSRGAEILIFDEPTSSLSQVETQRLFELIRGLKNRGVTSIYVSHRMNEIFELCDTVSVLRDGVHIETLPIAETDEQGLIHRMIGRDLDFETLEHKPNSKAIVTIEVKNLSSVGKFKDVNFSLRPGEIVGMAGLVGAGRSEVAASLFGLDPNAAGTVILNGKEVKLTKPTDALKAGIGLVPEDRKRHGLVLSMNARENITLPILKSISTLGWIKMKAERGIAQEYFDKLNVKAPSLNTPTASLSGGNQQKIALAKWLAGNCEVLIFDEPTRGVDVGAKSEIHKLIDKLAVEGRTILVISSELPELIGLCDRIIIMRDGKLAGEVQREQASEKALLQLMAG